MFGRGRRKQQDDPVVPPSPAVPRGVAGTPFRSSTLDLLDERARFAVFAGYEPLDDLRDALIELVQYDPDSEDAFRADPEGARRAVDEILARHVAAHEREAAAFPQQTDPERLAAVFAGLETGGILVGENEGYTQSDLSGEMWDRLRAHPEARGWTGFHEQDLDRAMHGGLLYLSFAHRSDQDADFALIAREVAERLRAAGFDAVWDDDPDARIEVRGIRWQRRRPV